MNCVFQTRELQGYTLRYGIIYNSPTVILSAVEESLCKWKTTYSRHSEHGEESGNAYANPAQSTQPIVGATIGRPFFVFTAYGST